MSGKYLGNHFTEKLPSCGYRTTFGWECLFVHDKPQLILSVYIGDFGLVGEPGNLAKRWTLMTDSGLELDPL